MSLKTEQLAAPLLLGERLFTGATAQRSTTVREPHARPWRRAAFRYLATTLVLDVVIALTVTTATAHSRYGTAEALTLGLLAAGGFIITTAACRGYRSNGVVDGTDELRSVLRVAGVLAIVSLAVHGAGVVHLPHALILEALLLTVALAMGSRIVHRAAVRRMRADGRLLRRTLLVGSPQSLEPVFDVLGETKAHGLSVVGICTPGISHAESQRPVLGDYDAVPALVEELGVEAVVVSSDAMGATELRRLGWRLAELPTELLVLPPLAEVAHNRLHVEPMAGTPLLAVSLRVPRLRRWTKAAFDRTVGLVMLIAALAIILPAALAVRLTSRGPAFFSQTRVGIDGQPFTMYKLRSMYEDAEARLAELTERSDGNGMLFKMRDDPRVTPVGRILRRLSVDELPQLWNVVRGDMSVVGPRPALPREVAEYDDVVAHRLRVKPGLTGLWQVSGRSNLSAERSVRLDLRYADNWTMGMDVQILCRTARAVLGGDGAY